MFDVADVPTSTARSKLGRRLSGRRGLRYRSRLVIGRRFLSIPLMIALAVILTSKSSASIVHEAEHGSEDVATAVAMRIEDWGAGRHQELALVAEQLGGSPDPADMKVMLDRLHQSGSNYGSLEVVDLNGTVMVTTTDQPLDVAGESWFPSITSGQSITE